jgi:signal transduction histidine kinase
VQSIMKLHGGRVDVVSIPDGETTFRMVFPARPV